jgi:hypothetical protein
MFAGTGVQLGTSNRWGDYTNMSLDPADDATFWYTNQYYNTSPAGGFAWKTKIGAFKFVGTVAPDQGTLTGTITACDTGAPLKDALVQVTGGPHGFLRRDQTRRYLFDEPVAWVLLGHDRRSRPQL